MFLDNKYTTWYNSIIFNSKSRSLGPEIYIEKHHIIPKSIGGDDSETNLAVLTAREHFICHLLLVKMLEGTSKYKMAHALWQMTRQNSKMKRDFRINSKIYEMIRMLHKEAASKFHKGSKKPRSKEHQANLTKSLIGRTYKNKNPSKHLGKTYEQIHGIENATKLRQLRSDHMTGRTVSDETKAKQSNQRKGKTLGGKNNNAKPVTLNGISFSCKKEAQEQLGITLYELNKLLNASI